MSAEKVKEFQQLCLQEVGVQLSEDDARTFAEIGLEMFKAIYRPIPHGNGNEILCHPRLQSEKIS